MKRVCSEDGTPIATWVCGSGPPLLLVHGTMADHSVWMPMQSALKHYYSVWVMDRRGRGHSGDSPAYTLINEAQDVAAVINAIGGKVNVLAHSFGGLCALETALLNSNVGRLIIYEIPVPWGGYPWSDEFDSRMQSLIDAGKMEEALFMFAKDIVKSGLKELSAIQNMSAQPMKAAVARTIVRESRLVDRYCFDSERLGKLNIPVLLIVGSKSPKHWHISSKTLQKALPDSRLFILDGQHHTAIQTAPDLLVEEIVGFLSAPLIET
ncbi:alpha/beta fold hydrolase [Desulfobacterium sp. N47]|uniref:alpha/beta fold hydrolase n=1 Tax=Desulfobacterium sp. N47 TaxID=3115210 RepID=UPI003C8033EE